MIADILRLCYRGAVKARWVYEDPEPAPRRIGWAVVASWIPGRFHLVFTFEMTGESPLERLTECFRSGKKFKDLQQGRHFFITSIAKCDEKGIVKEKHYMSPIYEKEYETLEDAKNGHRTIVDLFASGKLRC